MEKLTRIVLDKTTVVKRHKCQKDFKKEILEIQIIPIEHEDVIELAQTILPVLVKDLVQRACVHDYEYIGDEDLYISVCGCKWQKKTNVNSLQMQYKVLKNF